MLLFVVFIIASIIALAAHLVIRHNVKSAQHYTPSNAPTFVAPNKH